MKNWKQKRSIATVLAAISLSGTAWAAPTVDLSTIGWVQYGDAQSYSLPIANYQFGYSINSGPYTVDSTPGQISSLTVVATGSSGNPVTTNFSGMDNAYATPSGVSGSTFFTPNATTDQGSLGTVTNNGTNTWDASLLALKSFLGSDAMTVFFNNNQVNSGASSNQNLAAWAQVWVTDALGNTVGSVYDFTNRSQKTSNNAGHFDIVTATGGGTYLGDVTTYTGGGLGNPSGSLNGTTDWVLSGGAVCVMQKTGTTDTAVPVPCDTVAPTGYTVSAPINHNLGANNAAYAVIFPELNALMTSLFSTQTDADLAKYTLHADIRMGCKDGDAAWMACGVSNTGYGDALNNGYEQIFIGTSVNGSTVTVPEPGTIALVALGLIGFGRSRLNRKQ